MSSEFENAFKHIQSDDSLQPTILYGFSPMSKQNFDRFQQVWPTLTTDRREAIMLSLQEIAEQSFEVDFEPIFILGLDDKSHMVQVKAIEGLWESEAPVLIPPFIHLLKVGGTAEVRTAAAQGLGRFVYLGEIEEIAEEAYRITVQALLETIRSANEDIDVVRSDRIDCFC